MSMMQPDEALLFNVITVMPASSGLYFNSRLKVTKKVIKILRKEVDRECRRVERRRRMS